MIPRLLLGVAELTPAVLPLLHPGSARLWVTLCPSVNSLPHSDCSRYSALEGGGLVCSLPGAGVCGELVVENSSYLSRPLSSLAPWANYCVFVVSIVLPSYSSLSHPSSSLPQTMWLVSNR